MDSSSTLVLWPSKLKIGAKSKKDPQVKVVGLPPNVQKARELILADLDAKSERITLKIDVPFSEHSHVIGKEGANIKKVHEETKCHIHFPDSNRSLHTDKSNQVSITGQEKGVELARKRIRELLPVVVTFTLPLPGHIDPNSSDIQQMMLQYNVTIHIKPQPRHFSMLLVVRGTVRFQDGMKLAINKLVEYFTGDFRSLPQVMLNQDLAAQHHRTIIGSGGGNIRKIMEDSGTTIQFPDPQSRYQSNQVTITGSMDGVFRAREQLLGCLPVVLMFDVHDTDGSGLGTDRQTALVGELMQQWDVYISIKAKKQPIHSVIIKSIEQNMTCVYEARRRILEFVSNSARGLPDSAQMGVVNGKVVGELESSCESSLTSSVSEVAQPPGNRTVQIPMSFSEDRIASKAGFTSSGSYTTTGGGGWEEVGEGGSGLLPPEITVDEPGGLHSPTPEASDEASVVSPSLSLQPPRLTTRCFIDYDRKKEEAEKAKTSKIETTEPRKPTHYWSGYNFSESWAPGEGNIAIFDNVILRWRTDEDSSGTELSEQEWVPGSKATGVY
ncbi:Protein bicaudal C homolog 1-B [Geodia barretti]|nr:Protein bicaudal C homolog 1-B [Geodia barretti]